MLRTLKGWPTMIPITCGLYWQPFWSMTTAVWAPARSQQFAHDPDQHVGHRVAGADTSISFGTVSCSAATGIGFKFGTVPV